MIDLSGVIYSGGALLPNADRALGALRAKGLPYRFVTNTASKPLRLLLEQLAGFGLDIAPSDVFTPAQAAVAWLTANGCTPHLLAPPSLAEDFDDCPRDGPVAVVVGDAGRDFNYDTLNAAFRMLMDGAPFLALAQNRRFRDADGKLSMDAGAFVKALEYASGVMPELMGKPARAFFAAAANSMGMGPADVAMIGDDAEADVRGALVAGVSLGVLVRTGKYRPGDEDQAKANAVVDGIGEAVEFLLPA